MKKIVLSLVLALSLLSCKTGSRSGKSSSKENVKVAIDLNTITADKVLVTLMPPKFTTDETTFSIPKTVPGTYSSDNYGRYIDDLKAFDEKGNALEVTKSDDNNWKIKKAKSLAKITYWVNDTFDTESGEGFGKSDIFSPAGTNILDKTNFVVNTHGFVGYFAEKLHVPYEVTISHPENIWGATSMTDLDASKTNDVFDTPRYAVLVENPIMYAKPNYTTFNVNGMDIQIAVYSPTGKVTAESITPEMKKMMTAQKNFLGDINSTKKYSVLLYLSTMKPDDAKGFGALEHPTATTVVLPEMLPHDELQKSMKDVVSHEFFHIVTPLTIHSKEIQDFDYNDPKMSEHLWMYEGVTEYFANLFQINQGLIPESEFYSRIAEKIDEANTMNDTMSFTTMSKNVLVEPYKDQYLNVYQKGALIGMCIDIIIREKSNGERGILDLMHKLSKEYGENKAFDDAELFGKITQLTYPEVGEFLKTYVAGTTPIPYNTYLAKVGVTPSSEKKPGNPFLKGQVPYITINPQNKAITVVPDIELNTFFTNLNLKGGDEIVEINGVKYSLENIYDLITISQSWKENDPITVIINRNGKPETIKGTVKLPYEDSNSFQATDDSKKMLREAWLKK
ncbi:M61 family metallopeptidase [Flavobacterium agrisoli]|uniref:Peptidase M61 n=1 Tax=Flavobacterium agrisoli TaxID=2793066 RepID=A0A934PPP6_9FLAO|nr:peptidase M61 [Flavobacterium agrisoli]MBK0370775.1 peptidase M61 [Flavobacterium agrisoli]